MDEDVGQAWSWMPNGTVIIEELEKLAKRQKKKVATRGSNSTYRKKKACTWPAGTCHIMPTACILRWNWMARNIISRQWTVKPPQNICGRTTQLPDLPLRIAEYGTVYRYEQSGELFGLMRVRCPHMNDAHIYCSKNSLNRNSWRWTTCTWNILKYLVSTNTWCGSRCILLKAWR